ncbi:MAG: NADH-quinone oxidoreductase subunit I [Candidatus Gastranaerophilaceae bacterium]|jgi:NADH-quinone oxidoreductase subunit I
MFQLIKKTLKATKEIARGMYTIGKHIFRPAITLEYPEKKAKLNSRFRGRVALLVNEDGSDKCMACETCAKVCPCGDLIQIQKEKNENGKFFAKEFTIDIARCIFCGNCQEVCPVNAIVLTKEYELADYSRESLVLDKKQLTLTAEKSKVILEEKTIEM